MKCMRTCTIPAYRATAPPRQEGSLSLRANHEFFYGRGLLAYLQAAAESDEVESIEAWVAFVKGEGVEALETHCPSLPRKLRRITVSSMNDFNTQEAVAALVKLFPGDRVYVRFKRNDHLKRWRVVFKDGASATIGGSHNLTKAALCSGDNNQREYSVCLYMPPGQSNSANDPWLQDDLSVPLLSASEAIPYLAPGSSVTTKGVVFKPDDASQQRRVQLNDARKQLFKDWRQKHKVQGGVRKKKPLKKAPGQQFKTPGQPAKIRNALASWSTAELPHNKEGRPDQRIWTPVRMDQLPQAEQELAQTILAEGKRKYGKPFCLRQALDAAVASKQGSDSGASKQAQDAAASIQGSDAAGSGRECRGGSMELVRANDKLSRGPKCQAKADPEDPQLYYWVNELNTSSDGPDGRRKPLTHSEVVFVAIRSERDARRLEERRQAAHQAG